MSNFLVNIRIGLYHLQIDDSWKIRIKKNDCHKGYEDGFTWVYEFFGWTQTRYGFRKY
jgi:hypothetical protein